VFTGNQPRHIALIERLAENHRIFVVQEVTTLFPGYVEDFYCKSKAMQEYFGYVRRAEREIFGLPRLLPAGVRGIAIKAGDLRLIDPDYIDSALESDFYIVFGSSLIKGWLLTFLQDHYAINIHMGIAPQYRGSSCNFWALYDRHPELVGATIQTLAKKVDEGEILFHALPAVEEVNPFVLGMKSVMAAHIGLTKAIKGGEIFKMEPVRQDLSKTIRVTRNRDFTDKVAEDYLLLSPRFTNGDHEKVHNRAIGDFVRPFILN